MRGFYTLLVGAGWVTPGEFWKLHPFEAYWLLEAKTKGTPERQKQEVNARLYDMLKARKKKEAA